MSSSTEASRHHHRHRNGSASSRPDERTSLLRGSVGKGYQASGDGGAPPPGYVQETALSGNPAAAGRRGDANGNGAAKAAPARQVGPDLLRGVLMLFMAIDHTSVAVGGYAHGQGMITEAPSTVIEAFNDDWAYLLRTLSHLCAPGFSMLMGMGLAYWVSSRVKRGQSFPELASHLSSRALAILVLNQVAFSFVALQGIWVINTVLWALAIDYLVVGLLAACVVLWIEPALTSLLSSLLVEDDEDLDAAEAAAAVGMRPPQPRKSGRPATYAFWTINAALLALSALFIWVNVWTAPNHGKCPAPVGGALLAQDRPMHAEGVFPVSNCDVEPKLIYDFLFGMLNCTNLGLISVFPPVGWLSFVLFGLLYGRILVRSSWKSSAVVGFNALLSVLFAALFVSTRLLGYGNLSTDCLRTPDQRRQAPGTNQYLASLKSFLYMTKYPPSPAYAFGTLSMCFALLAVLDVAALWHRLARANKVLLTFGTNALFFYGFHLLFINFFGLAVVSTPLSRPLPWAPDRKGVGLGWAFWASYTVLIVVSYEACKGYAAYKASRGPQSLLRFL